MASCQFISCSVQLLMKTGKDGMTFNGLHLTEESLVLFATFQPISLFCSSFSPLLTFFPHVYFPCISFLLLCPVLFFLFFPFSLSFILSLPFLFLFLFLFHSFHLLFLSFLFFSFRLILSLLLFYPLFLFFLFASLFFLTFLCLLLYIPSYLVSCSFLSFLFISFIFLLFL